MLFIDDVCQIVFMDGAAFEAKHPRDSGGKFSTFGAGTRKSKSQLKREHKAKTLEQFYGEEIKGVVRLVSSLEGQESQRSSGVVQDA